MLGQAGAEAERDALCRPGLSRRRRRHAKGGRASPNQCSAAHQPSGQVLSRCDPPLIIGSASHEAAALQMHRSGLCPVAVSHCAGLAQQSAVEKGESPHPTHARPAVGPAVSPTTPVYPTQAPPHPTHPPIVKTSPAFMMPLALLCA